MSTRFIAILYCTSHGESFYVRIDVVAPARTRHALLAAEAQRAASEYAADTDRLLVDVLTPRCLRAQGSAAARSDLKFQIQNETSKTPVA